MQTTTSGKTAGVLEQAWHRATRVRTLFASDDPACVRASVGKVFRPHQLRVAGGGALRASMDYLPVGELSLSRLRYGREVEILPGPLERFYLLQMPLRGRARIGTEVRDFDSHVACASLLSPQPDLRMHWSADNDQLILRIDAALVRRFCVAWCGDERLPAPVFEPCLALDEVPLLGELLESLVFLGERDASPEGPNALSVVQLQYRLLAALLVHQPHSVQERLAAQCPPLAPRHVRRVEEYLLAHPHEAITPDRLAEIAGVSVRSLFLGFQRYRGISPMKFLRELRLHRVRDELLLAPEGTTVTEVALRWGFYHLGRFAQEYRALFGQSPSQTRAQMH